MLNLTPSAPPAPYPPPLLVIDDNQATRHSLASLLHVHGYRVSESSDGAAALSLLAASPERMVVLVDVWLPNMDALALLQAVASHPDLARRHAYIALTASTADTTGYSLPSHLTALLAQLHIPVLARPFDIDALLRLLRAAQQRLETEVDEEAGA
ncbi:MAG TPA: response regulator [Ktedonobacterales bacterium]|jgi:two-component system response regulator MprA